jgi:magnesium chelatase accessory protein
MHARWPVRCSARPDAVADTGLDWERDGGSWPLHESSRFVDAGGLRWHVQELGAGPALLLIHGTGSSAHSWHRLAPLLAARWSVTAFDLPGHGFTRGVPEFGMSLAGMSGAVGALLGALGASPVLVVGHSAGAAIAARMALERQFAPRALISLNGALLPFDRYHDLMFAPLAKLLASMPFAASLFSWRARDRGAVDRLIESTGSRLDRADVDLYWRLVQSPRHIAGVLQMMAQWDLGELQRQLPQLPIALLQLVGANDRTVPPSAALRVRALLPAASIVSLPGLGHLAHEERADLVAQAIFAAADALHV